MGPKDLRAAAEQAAFKPVQKFKPEAEVDLERLVQELRVHQIELEMQNQELVAAQLAAEESQREYHRLFESAPAGYLMLDAATCVVRANAAAGRRSKPLHAPGSKGSRAFARAYIRRVASWARCM
jgi:PAS domain-containing protein